MTRPSLALGAQASAALATMGAITAVRTGGWAARRSSSWARRAVMCACWSGVAACAPQEASAVAPPCCHRRAPEQRGPWCQPWLRSRPDHRWPWGSRFGLWRGWRRQSVGLGAAVAWTSARVWPGNRPPGFTPAVFFFCGILPLLVFLHLFSPHGRCLCW